MKYVFKSFLYQNHNLSASLQNLRNSRRGLQLLAIEPAYSNNHIRTKPSVKDRTIQEKSYPI